MAFQNVIDALSSTIHRDTISNPMVEQINAPLRESLEIFKYQLPPKALKFLNECGIDVTQFGPQTHPHPWHKTIELHLLMKVWPCLASCNSDVMFMKESKFKKIQEKNKSFKEVWNYKFASKDASRYTSLRTTAPSSKVLFIHDALMYFSREQLLGLFGVCKNLERVFASLVVPAECEVCETSLFPSFYKYYKDRDKLVYQPENHAAGSYRQPFSAIEWLKTSKIQGPEFTLRICVLESWGPVHHLLIEKSEAPGDEDYDSVSFKVPDCVLLPNPLQVDQGIRNRLVPAKVYNACFSYVRSVRTLRETDPAGYIRTQMNKEEYDWVTPSAWDNLQSFVLRTAGARPGLNYALFESPVAKLLNKLSIHSEKWGWLLAASASVATFMLSRFAFDLARSEIISFSFLWSWFKSPKREWYQLFRKKPKFLSLQKEPKRIDLLGRKDLRPLVEEYPFVFHRFLPREMNRWSLPVSLILAAVPILAQGWRHFTQKHAPQQLDQIYQAFFHPSPWTLSLARKPVRLSPKPFFPEEKVMQMDAGSKPKDDAFMPHPDVIEKAEEKFSFVQEEEVEKKAESEKEEDEEEQSEEEDDESESSSSSSSSSDDDDDDDKDEITKETEDEAELENAAGNENSQEGFGVPDLLAESDDDQAQAQPASPIAGGGAGGIWLRHLQNASCGVKKYQMGGYKIDLSNFQAQSLRGRSCIFFAKHDMTYGHDKVLYHNFGWPLDIASVSRFLSTQFKCDFNSVLINIYEDGSSLNWHADDEICYDDKSPILTLNLQGEGFFNTRHEHDKLCNRELLIKDDLLEMPIGFQSSHKHCIAGCVNSRISATFRHQNFSIPVAQKGKTAVSSRSKQAENHASKRHKAWQGKKNEEKEKAASSSNGSADARKSAGKKRKVDQSMKDASEERPAKVRPYEPEPKVSEQKAKTKSSKKRSSKRTHSKEGNISSEEKPSTDVAGVIPIQPENEEDEPPKRGDLLSDASAIGPVVRFCDHLKAAYVQNVALFLTRERNGSAPAPKMPKQACLLEAFSKRTGVSQQELWSSLCRTLPNCLLENPEIKSKGLNSEHLTVLGALYQKKILLHTESGVFEYGVQGDKVETIHINHSAEKGNFPGHFFVGGRVLPKKAINKKQKCGDLMHAVLSFKIDDDLLPIKKIHDFETTVSRAKNLIANMKNGFDGVMANVEPLYPSKAREKFLSLDLIMDAAVSKKVKLIHIAGFAGCGKSFPIQNLLCLPMFKSHKVAVPTVELRGEWKEAMGYSESEKWRVSTWESSMLKSARVLVIDEVYKMPRGYVDLAIHADSSVQLVILLGDPIQGEYHSTHPSSNNKILSPESEYLRPFMDYYCLWSRRVPQNVAKFFNVQSTNKFGGIKKFQRAFPSNVPILCNAVVTAKTLADTGHYSTTIASSQGSTYDEVACINLDRSSSMLSKQLSLVALTRSKKGVVFCGDKRKLTKDASCNPLFADFWHDQVQDVTEVFQKTFSDLTVIRSPIKKRSELFSGKGSKRTLKRREQRSNLKKIHLKDSFATRKAPKNPSIDPNSRMDVIIDLSEPVTGDGSLNAPQISTHFLPETRRPLHYDFASAVASDPKAGAVHFSQSAAECVYPGENFDTLAALLVPAHDPEMKEIVFKDLRSNQFPLLNVKFELGALPSSLVAAKHSSKEDPTLLPASIEKRLRFRQSEASYEITAKDQLLGTLLYDSLCKAYNRNPNHSEPFDEELFAECINVNEYAQLSNKTQAFIMANAVRSDPDWRYTVVRIFSKTQHKINEATVFGNWKACQTLALMHDAVILILGPVKKYQRIFDKKDRPSTLYVHAGNTPYQMSEWCKLNLSKSEHLSNDYTAFDQSQHGEAVVLEIKKMERLNIPQNLIDFHVWLKTNVQTQFGPLTCMRLTGEPGTYDDNTDYNIAVLHSEYLIGKIPCMVSGDDSMLDKEPPPNPIWKFVEPLLNLRFKKFKSFYALFCGYYVGKEGACRSPLTLFAKLATAVDDKSIRDKRLSYLTEFAVGHSLGQDMWLLFEEDQVQYQCANFDFFCRNCPREEKVLLRLGEPDQNFLNKLFSAASYISNPVFALLKRSVRKLYLGKRSESSPISDPDSERMIQVLAELF